MKEIFRKEELKKRPEGFSAFRERLHEIIFESETKEGKWFDIILLLMIVLSIFVLMLETVPKYYSLYGKTFLILEWTFTFFFYCGIFITDLYGKQSEVLYHQLFWPGRPFFHITELPHLVFPGASFAHDYQRAQANTDFQNIQTRRVYRPGKYDCHCLG